MTTKRELIRGFTAGALLLALAVPLSSCGGGSGASATASEPLTKSEFVKRMSQICESEENRKARKLEAASKLGKNFLGGSPKELTELVTEEILPLYGEMIEEMAALNPPAGEKAEVKRLIGKYEKTLEKAEANPKREVFKDSFFPVNREAEKLGIKNCTL